MTELELAWVAGLLEGEGCFSRKSQKVGTRSKILVECHMTDRDVLARLHGCVGVGTLSGPYKNGRKTHYKLRWMFRVSGQPAYELMMRLLPLMCSRRSTKIRELMAEFEAQPRRIFVVQNVASGEITRLEGAGVWKIWLEEHGVSEAGMYRTMTGARRQCRGWIRLKPDSSTR